MKPPRIRSRPGRLGASQRLSRCRAPSASAVPVRRPAPRPGVRGRAVARDEDDAAMCVKNAHFPHTQKYNAMRPRYSVSRSANPGASRATRCRLIPTVRRQRVPTNGNAGFQSTPTGFYGPRRPRTTVRRVPAHAARRARIEDRRWGGLARNRLESRRARAILPGYREVRARGRRVVRGR